MSRVLHITDAMAEAAIDPAEAEEALTAAFRDFAEGRAAAQERVRTAAAEVKLSTMGAVLPAAGVAGAKVYTTIAGRFSFAIVLFSAETGALLALLDAEAITSLRTATCSVIAARRLARRSAKRLALFGPGAQGRAHAIRLAAAFPLTDILICSRSRPRQAIAEISAASGCDVRFAAAEEALADADIVVTASRATTPLFDGTLLRPGTFVAAVGSSLPETRELDDATLRRANIIVVEWRRQALREAGDLVLAAAGAAPPEKVIELGELLTGRAPARRNPDDIAIFKSVGIGLADVALAALAYRRIAG
jgi:ornithine cyclodeaminase